MRTEVETSRRLYGADWLSLMSHGRNAAGTTAENGNSAAAVETKNSAAGKRNSVADKNNRLADSGGNLVTSKGKTRHAHR